jgi:hypothetical protein
MNGNWQEIKLSANFSYHKSKKEKNHYNKKSKKVTK